MIESFEMIMVSKHRGMITQNFNNELVARVFVDQVTPDIQKYFKEHMAGWQRGTLQKTPSFMVMFMCYMFMFDGWEETHTELNLQRKRNRKSNKRLVF